MPLVPKKKPRVKTLAKASEQAAGKSARSKKSEGASGEGVAREPAKRKSR